MPKPRQDDPWYRDKLLLSAVGLILSTALLGAGLLAYLYEQTMREGMRLTGAFAAVIDEQTSRTLQAIDLRMERLSDTLADIDQANGSGEAIRPRIQEALRASINALPFIDSLLMISADGTVRHTSDPTVQEADLSNRDYLTIYRTRPSTGFFIGAPVVGRNGEWLLPIARPLGNDRQGSAGVLLAHIHVTYFDRLWASLALEADSSVGLLRSDGQMLLRSPIDASAMGRSLSQSPLFLQHLPSSPHGGYRIQSTIDGKDRYFAYRTLAEQPSLVVIVGRTIDAILAPWYRLALLVVVVWFAASLSLLLLSIRLTRQSARRKWAESANAALAQRLRIASESAGLVLWEWDLEADTWEVTPTYYTTLGYPPQTGPVTQAQWQALVHPNDQASVQLQSSHIRGHADDKYDQLFRVRHADGNYHWMRITGRVHTRDAQGRPTRRIGICIDVTDRVLAEQERLQMVERISDALVTLSANWRITHANARAGVLLGHRPEALIGQDVWMVFPASVGFRLREVCERCMTTQKPELLEEYYAPTDIWYESHIYPSPEGLSVYFRDITERKLAEQDLRDAKEQAENLINGANVMVVGLDTRGQITIFNKMAQDLTGYTLADLAGRNWFEILAPRERYPLVHAEFERLFAGGVPQLFEHPILTANGEERVIAWQNSVLHDGGIITGILSFGMDVSLRRKAERELAESKEQFETLASNSLQGIALMRKAHIVYANPAYCAITGRSAFELTSHTVQQMLQWIHPDDRAASMERMQRIAEGKALPKTSELRILTGQGQWRWVQSATRQIMMGGAPAILGMVLDIHDRHLAEEALRTSEERFRSAFDSSGIGMGLTAMDGHWMQANPSLCHIVGYSSEELCQRTFMEMTHPDDLAVDEQNMEQLLAGRIPHFAMEKRYLHRDGHPVWVGLTVALVRGDDGTPLHTVAQIENIDSRKKAELALHHAKEFSENLLENANAMVVGMDRQGRITLFNQAAQRITGHDAVALLGKSALEMLGMPNRFPPAPDGSRRALDGIGARFHEGVIVTRSGAQRQISWQNSAIMEDGQIVGILSFGIDDTERNLAEAALRTSEERFRQLAENIPQVFWLLDPVGREMLYCSAAYEVVWGRSCAGLFADLHSWIDAVHPDDQSRIGDRLLERQMHGGYDEEYRIVRPDGSIRWIRDRAFPIRDAQGKVYRVSGIADDITERRESLLALRESTRQLKSLSRRVLDAQETERRRLARELHDELGQSLTSLKISIQTQQRFGTRPAQESLSEYVAMVESALQQVRRLALALRPSMLDDLGLVPALRWMTEQTAARTSLAIRFLPALPGQVRLVSDVETACFRIVQEALTNITRYAHAQHVEIDLGREGDQLVLAIRDDGQGFDLVAARARAMAGGSLGVLGMQERAMLIGGALEIRTSRGDGCTVLMRCPWRVAAAR